MFWNKKGDKASLPDLPPLKTGFAQPLSISDDEDDGIIEKHDLPSFPDSPIKQGFSQAAIKDAVTTQEIEEDSAGMNEEDEFQSTAPPLPLPRFKSAPLERSLPPPPEPEPAVFKKPIKGDVFVKIDKFHAARRALQAAQEKVDEIDHLLKKIRETRMREEQELTAWEKDITSVKTRVEDVSKNLFDKLT
ncbi:hypothetical protein HYZ97_00235 [Candidatus Pacearchaeota archaeon]|nr:hypothetical protein [Candidatus Pacearchaeota archaeon]